MSTEKTTSNSTKRKQKKGATPNTDTRLATGGGLHQIADGEPPALTTNQGVALTDNQNSLRANPRGATLLEDFILREKMTLFDYERIPERIVRARATGIGQKRFGQFSVWAVATLDCIMVITSYE